MNLVFVKGNPNSTACADYGAGPPVIGFAGAKHISTKNVEMLQKVCDELGLELKLAGYVNGRGELSHEKMQDFYMGIDVYVHPSTTEGFNNTIIEALSCNIPVLMTKEGAWKEFEGWVDFIEPTEVGIKFALQKYTGHKLILEKYLWKNLMQPYRSMYEAIKNADTYRTN